MTKILTDRYSVQEVLKNKNFIISNTKFHILDYENES